MSELPQVSVTHVPELISFIKNGWRSNRLCGMLVRAKRGHLMSLELFNLLGLSRSLNEHDLLDGIKISYLLWARDKMLITLYEVSLLYRVYRSCSQRDWMVNMSKISVVVVQQRADP